MSSFEGSGGRRLHFAEPLNSTMVVFLVLFAAIFVAQAVIPPFHRFAIDYLAMNTATFLARLHLWQALTAIFLHGGVAHFLGNMIFFWFFGSALANAWGRRDFLSYFFACGVAASLCFFGFNVVRGAPPEGLRGFGASGVVFGVMIGYAMVYGERTLLAFFLIPMKAKYFVAICFAIEVLLLWRGVPDGVSHVAHAGGAVIARRL